MRPKVSIIVPVYNAEDYLQQALQSLQDQTLTDIEVVIVDNASTDNSYDIANSFTRDDDRFKLYRQKENVGQNRNVMYGLTKTHGEYIAEHDADDYCKPEMYERLYALGHETDAEVVKCGFYNVYKDVPIPCNQEPYWWHSGLHTPFATMELDRMRRMSVIGRQCHIQSGIALKSFIQDNNLGYRPNGVFEDTSLSFKIRTLAQRYIYLPECLYYYRKDNPASGSATINNIYAICEQYEEIKRFNNLYNLGLDEEIETMRYYSYTWNTFRITNEEQRMEFLIKAGHDYRLGNAPRELFNSDTDYNGYRFIAENG